MTNFAKNMSMKAWYIPALFIFAVACINNTDKEKSASVDSPAVSNNEPNLTAAPTTDPSKLSSIEWLDSAKKINPVTEGEVVKISYKFRNNGKAPLVIENVLPGCGCTVADYPKKAIAPGEESEIKAEFDSHGREGIQNKNITVNANTPEKTYTLYFSVTVNKKS